VSMHATARLQVFPYYSYLLHLYLCRILDIFTHVFVERNYQMATNLAINEQLLAEAQKVGQHHTKKSTVNAALAEYIKRRREQEIIELFGKIDYNPDYDYKRAREQA